MCDSGSVSQREPGLPVFMHCGSFPGGDPAVFSRVTRPPEETSVAGTGSTSFAL